MFKLSGKRISFGFVLVVIISLAFCNIFTFYKVDAKSLYRSEKIPFSMQPGSLIKYINNC